MRLLMLPRYDAQGASSRLRMLQYLPALQDAGVEVVVSPLLGDGYVTNLYAGQVSSLRVFKAYLRQLRCLLAARKFDVLWVEKEALPWLPAWLERLALPSRPRLVVDYDDAVFHRYDQHGSALVRGMLAGKIDAVMRRADLVTAGNDYLAERARSAGCQRVEWLPTVIDLQRYPLQTRVGNTEGVTIGWIGSPSTADYLQVLVPVAEALAAHHRVRFVAIGARPDQVQGTPFESWTWSESEEVCLLRQLDIGVMPLPDEPWERGKCGYKLIQYMACGLPVVASPVGVNTRIVQPGVNGWLASTAAEWSDALFRLIVDAGLRQRMGIEGRREVEDTYCLQVQDKRLVDMLRRLHDPQYKDGGACAD